MRLRKEQLVHCTNNRDRICKYHQSHLCTPPQKKGELGGAGGKITRKKDSRMGKGGGLDSHYTASNIHPKSSKVLKLIE